VGEPFEELLVSREQGGQPRLKPEAHRLAAVMAAVVLPWVILT
jgi:hypothetical protein